MRLVIIYFNFKFFNNGPGRSWDKPGSFLRRGKRETFDLSVVTVISFTNVHIPL